MRKLHRLLAISTLVATFSGGGLAVSNVEHRTILAAVEQGDCLAAGRELEKHIQNGRDRFIRAMSATGQLVLTEISAGKFGRKRA